MSGESDNHAHETGDPNQQDVLTDLKEALQTIRSHYDSGTEDVCKTAWTMRAIAHDALWRNKMLPKNAR